MPLINGSQLRNVDRDFTGRPEITIERGKSARLTTVRRATALVMETLRKENNFFVTGQQGFASMGIKSQDELNPKNENFNQRGAVAIGRKIAEVMVLLTCAKAELHRYARDSAAFEEAVFDLMEGLTLPELMECMEPLQEAFDEVNRSAVSVPDDERTPLGSLTEDTEKKPVPAGSPVM